MAGSAVSSKFLLIIVNGTAALAGCTALLHMFAPRLGIYLTALHRATSCRIAAAVDARPAVGGYRGGVL